MPRPLLGLARFLARDRTSPGVPARATSGKRWTGRRLALIGMVVVVAVTGVVLLDERWLASRLDHVSVSFPSSATRGETWVLVGSDRRTDVDASFGTAAQVPGARADVVLVVHRVAGRVHVLSVPRDLLVRIDDGTMVRVALTLEDGVQQLVNGLCRTLNIPATHLVVLTMAAFERVVNAVDGVPITLSYAVRDSVADLALPAGHYRLTGAQALALVRSRHPESRIGGRWVTTSEVAGAAHRTTEAADVFAALQRELRGAFWHPIRMQRVALAATSGLTTDRHTGLLTLARLRSGGSAPVSLPSAPLGHGIATISTAQTTAALRAAGYAAPCSAS
ncbi:MAG TPA: LCP family protein [Jatrophihabitantaceae bacterium]|nr:LCP family protein [Jatrophihabitantaceae bacterium]